MSVHPSVCPSVRLSVRRTPVFRHTGALDEGGMKNLAFRPLSSHISETIQDTARVTTECE